MRSAAVLGLLVLLVPALSGCFTEEAPTPEPAVPATPAGDPIANATTRPVLLEDEDASARWNDPAVALVGCSTGCLEPSVATDDAGRIYVAASIGGEVVRSDDEGSTWVRIDPPLSSPYETAARVSRTDGHVQISPSGSLYFTSLAAVAGLGLYGIHVARSDDQGATWPLNIVLEPASANVVAVPDRQWLGFAPDGSIVLTYNQIPTGIWFMRSTDEGATWSGWTRVHEYEDRNTFGQSGPPVISTSGRIAVPACMDLESDRVVGLAISDDDGATWSLHATPPIGCDFFPIATWAKDSIVIATQNAADDVVLIQSLDGGTTWGEPSTWGADSPSSPWVEAEETGAVSAAWFVRGEEGASLFHGRAGGTATLVADGIPGSKAGTDFAHFAALPDGRAVIVWSSGESVMVRVERAAAE